MRSPSISQPVKRLIDVRMTTGASTGLAKTRRQQLLIGAAVNVARLAAWFAERTRATTRPSRVAALVA